MSSQERPPQKSSARTTAGRRNANPMPMNTAQGDTQFDDSYLLGEDDPYASSPPRPHSSAIRLSPQGQAPRRSSRGDVTTETQTRRTSPNYIPPRSTQKQNPSQITGTMAPRPVRNVTTNYDAPVPNKQERRNVHWLLYVGMGMLVALALWVLAGNVLNWGMNEYNNLLYGYPRTFQTDQVVGHNDSTVSPSHFVAINLHGQIIVVEFPGGNPSKAIDYVGPDLIGTGEDQLPVTLTFSDINHDGKIDMIIHVTDRSFVFYNTGTGFAANNTNPSPTATP